MRPDSSISNHHRTIVHQVLKDFFNGHVLRNIQEVKRACKTIFERKGYVVLPDISLNSLVIDEGTKLFKRDPRELDERPYKERLKPRSLFEASKGHYTAAEKNFVRKILKVLGEKTSVNLLKQSSIDRVVSLFKELYPRIFGNEHYRTDDAIIALIRREQKRLDYGFIEAYKSICEDDIQDAKKLRNLRKLILRRIRKVEDEQPFLL